uniref:Uncharacterized protein n=1 Tax=Plectus sambesii TaxID=2011161 RepID=A0A914WU17_9BILA
MPQYVYEPWYLRRAPPVFCMPCLPAYSGIYKARKPILIIGAVLFCIGFIILLSLLLTCIAIHCGTVVAGLLPLALILMIVGLLLFHCGWAAHLLDDGALPVTTTTTTAKEEVDEKKEMAALFETAHVQPGEENEVPTGFWQFADKSAWQHVSSRDTQLQQTTLTAYRK